MFKSAILKLTFWYVLLSVLLSLLFSGVIYRFATHELREGLQNQYHALETNDHDSDNVATLPTAELNDRSSNLITDLVYFNIVVFLGSTLVSYILARRTMRPIEEAHQAQMIFTAEASHELRTPLAGMRADTESVLMQKNKDLHMMQTALEDNLQDILKIQKLTDHLLQMSRYKSHGTLAHEPIDLQELVRETITQFERQQPKNEINIELTGKPIHVVADQMVIQQLVAIILDNAIKYSKSRSQIRIVLEENAGKLSIVVTDKGVGINPKDLPHIFEHFYRSSNAKNKQNQASGYGLGLPLAKNIVDLYHGQIIIESVEKEGTTVTVELPVKFLR